MNESVYFCWCFFLEISIAGVVVWQIMYRPKDINAFLAYLSLTVNVLHLLRTQMCGEHTETREIFRVCIIFKFTLILLSNSGDIELCDVFSGNSQQMKKKNGKYDQVSYGILMKLWPLSKVIMILFMDIKWWFFFLFLIILFKEFRVYCLFSKSTLSPAYHYTI